MNFYDWRLRISLAAAGANKEQSPVTRVRRGRRVSVRPQNLWRQLGNAGFRTVAASRRFRLA